MDDKVLINWMDEIEKLIKSVRKEVQESHNNTGDTFPNQEFFTLREAVELKYGKNAPYSTISTNYALMPCGNTNFEIVGGCRRWHRKFIKDWISVADKDLISYLQLFNVRLTGRIGEKYLKKYGNQENHYENK